MSKLSIVFKLLTVLSVLVLSLAGVGVMAIGTMQNINSHTVEIAESWLPSVRALGSLRADINELRVALRLHLMQDTAEGKEAAEKRLASLRARIDQTRKVYEPLITSAEERSLYGQWTHGVGRVSERRAGRHGAVAQGRWQVPDRRQRAAADQGREDGPGRRSAAPEGHRAQQPRRRARDEAGGRQLRHDLPRAGRHHRRSRS